MLKAVEELPKKIDMLFLAKMDPLLLHCYSPLL
jgi:hypothetical protein